MEFKVGDKIKFVGISPTRWIGRVGIIDEVREHGREFPYSIKFNGDRFGGYPVLMREIEKISEKGRQLLFSFME